MSRLGTTTVLPLGFGRTPDQSMALCLPQNDSVLGPSSGYNFATMRDMFGILASGDTSSPQALLNTPQGSATNQKQFLQAIDLTAEYANRVVSGFGTLVTAAVLNFRNSFITSLLCPFLETSELNFTISQEEYNQVEFKRVNTAGIGNEQTYFQWSWSDTVEPYVKEARITEELALDVNFGASRYLKELQTFATTALKTADLNDIYQILSNAWRNRTYFRDREVMGSFEVQKAWNAESWTFHIAAKDIDGFLTIVRNLEDEIDGLDTVVVQDKTWQYTRGIIADPAPVIGSRLRVDEESGRFVTDVFSAGDSLKTLPIGNRGIDFFELKGFRVNTFDKYIEHPLETRVTLCHYFGPDAKINAHTPFVGNNPDLANIEVFYQTKSVGEPRTITLEQRLRACHYFDPHTGEVSQNTRAFLYRLTQDVSNNKDLVPWSWNDRRGKPGLTIDDEDISFGYNHPDMMDVNNKKLADMNYRSQFFGGTYLPDRKQYVAPGRLGDYHLAAMPNAWLLRGARGLALYTQNSSAVNDLDGIYVSTWSLLQGMRNAVPSAVYLSDLAEANSNGTRAITELTPESKLRRFPNAHRIEEWRPNQYGALRLPTKEGRNYGKYPAGFQFGGGIQTLADEAANPNSPWKEAAQEAQSVLKYWLSKGTYLDQALGTNDTADASLTPPWIHVDSQINALFESFFGRSTPTFLAQAADGFRQQTLFEALVAWWNAVSEEEGEGPVTSAEFVAQVDGWRTGGGDNSRRYVSDLTRVLSLLYTPVRERFMAFYSRLSADTRAAIDDSLHLLATLILREAVPEYKEGKVKVAKFKVVSAIVADVLSRIGDSTDAQTINRELRDASKRFFGSASTGQEKAANVQKAMVAINTMSDDLGFATALKNYEDANVGNVGSNGRYFRAPLMWGEGMLEQTRGENSPLKRADPVTFYETPLNDELSDERRKELRDVFDLRTGIHGLAMKHVVHSQFATRLSAGGDSGSIHQNVPSFSAPFSPLSTKSRSKKLSSLLEMGARTGFDVEMQDPRQVSGASRGSLQVDDSGKVFYEFQNSLKEEYFGPWRKRLEFANTIDSPAERFFFMALLQARNHLDTFVKLARINIELMGVMVFRPFVQYNCFSAIAMKRGAATNLTAVGHAVVKVTKEHRGIYHMRCEFRMGYIRTNPLNIAVIPFAFPASFIGGKKVDFMMRVENFYLANPNKESCIAMPMSVDERDFSARFHMLNRDMIGEDADYAPYEMKWSSAPFYAFTFGEENVHMVETQHEERITHDMWTTASHVAHRCCVTRMDPVSPVPRKIDYDASGPGCSLRENTAGAELTAMGRAVAYPQRI